MIYRCSYCRRASMIVGVGQLMDAMVRLLSLGRYGSTFRMRLTLYAYNRYPLQKAANPLQD